MAVVRKKQDDKYLKTLRELVTSGGSGGNRQCFDCGQKGPTYVNMTIGSFVCTRCSGVLRGLTPPQRVKSISMATFTQDEIEFLKAHGNELCAKTWLGLWDPKRVVNQEQREMMIDKYERKRYYLEPASPLKSLTNASTLKTATLNTSSAMMNDYGHNHHHHHNGNGGGQNIKENTFQNIQITPPVSQRNGHPRTTTTSSSSMNQHQHHDAFTLNGTQHQSNGLNSSIDSETNSCASNSFGPDADFVADFGSANIFDGTNTTIGASSMVGVVVAPPPPPSNGYGRIQPMKTANYQKQQMQMQPNQSQMRNDIFNDAGSTGAENFADFEHAPIYNATTAVTIPKGKGTAVATTSNNNNKLSSTPTVDRYAALKDLDEQLREIKSVTSNDSFGNNNNNNNGAPLSSGINPFKIQQQQQQQQQQQLNPFNQGQHQHHQITVNSNDSINGNVVASSQGPHNPYGQINVMSNGYSQQQLQQQHQQQQQQLNQAAFMAGSPMFPSVATGKPNGCGFGFGTLQQQHQMASSNGGSLMMGGTGMAGGSTYNNPFAANDGLNTNNPFL